MFVVELIGYGESWNGESVNAYNDDVLFNANLFLKLTTK